ncbi:hypothetical protein GYB59_02130 [bacterium]|nr:hypothetical protein [bacterium]
MAVLTRELTYARKAGVGETRSFSEVWVVTCSSHEDNEFGIVKKYNDWRWGEEHPKHKGYFVDDTDFDRSEDEIVTYTVTVNYSDDWPEEPDPRKRPPVYSLKSITHSYTDVMDADGTPFTNTAGDFMQDIPERSISAWRLTIKKNLPVTWPDWLKEDFNEAVNKSEIKIAGLKWPKHTLRIADLDIGEPEEEKIFRFCPMTMVIEFHPKTWAIKSVSRGLFERYVDSGTIAGEPPKWKKRLILNSNGEPIDEPVFLDKQGTAIREEKKPVSEFLPEGAEGGDFAGAFVYTGELKTKLDPEEIEYVENWNNPRKDFKKLPITR